MTEITREQFIEYIANNSKSIEDIQGHLKQFIGPVLEKMLQAEMDEHLGYKKHSKEGYNSGNSRNGYQNKKIKTTSGEDSVKIPRDRNGGFEPQILPKYENKTNEIEQKIINMYGLGLSVRDIQEHVLDIYGADISPTLVSNITDKVIPEIKEWQGRPLESCYPIVYLDAIHFKVKSNGTYVNKGVYIVIGIGISGLKDVLGIYVGENESSSFWQKVCNDLNNRGVKDICIACIDGLSGFGTAIKNVFPTVEIQRCIIHQIRYTMQYINYQDTKEFMKSLKLIYQSDTLENAEFALLELREKWGKKYNISVTSWEKNWADLSTYFKFPQCIRRIIYTTNTIEGYNRQLRKVTKTKTVFPDDDSLLKILYLVTRKITKKWTMPIHNWGMILGQLDSFYPEIISKYQI